MNFGGAHDTCFKYVFGCLLYIYEKEKKRKEENRSEALEIKKNNNNNRNTEQEQKRVGKSKSIKFAILDLHLPGFVVMAVNPQLFPNGMPVPFVNELFVLARDGVEFEVDKIPGSVSSSFWFFSLFLT